jgi:hypothetical protein
MGPGTELKRLLSKVGISSKSGCNCDQRALVMDDEGPEWCEKNIETIISWLKEEAAARGLPFERFTVKGLIYLAIYLAKRKERILCDGPTE